MDCLPSTSRCSFLSGAIAATSVGIPATAAVAAKPTPPDEAELLKHYRRLGPEKQRSIVGWTKFCAEN